MAWHQVLQLKPEAATGEELNAAYRRVSLSVHPDKCKHPRAEEAFACAGVRAGTGGQGVPAVPPLHALRCAKQEVPQLSLCACRAARVRGWPDNWRTVTHAACSNGLHVL